eukprot:scaffold1929_cov376-Prasinococcus_capsulatus_cf.AAC.26
MHGHRHGLRGPPTPREPPPEADSTPPARPRRARPAGRGGRARVGGQRPQRVAVGALPCFAPLSGAPVPEVLGGGSARPALADRNPVGGWGRARSIRTRGDDP